MPQDEGSPARKGGEDVTHVIATQLNHDCNHESPNRSGTVPWGSPCSRSLKCRRIQSSLVQRWFLLHS